MIYVVYVMALLILSGTSGFYIGNYVPAAEPKLEDYQWGYTNYMCHENWLHTYPSGRITQHEHVICNI